MVAQWRCSRTFHLLFGSLLQKTFFFPTNFFLFLCVLGVFLMWCCTERTVLLPCTCYCLFVVPLCVCFLLKGLNHDILLLLAGKSTDTGCANTHNAIGLCARMKELLSGKQKKWFLLFSCVWSRICSDMFKRNRNSICCSNSRVIVG